jgi:hypothetical protein
MAFDLPNASKQLKLPWNCAFSNITNTSEWQYSWGTELPVATTLPNCFYVCGHEPPLDKTVQNRTWDNGKFGIGTIASYVCQGEIDKALIMC